MMMDSRWGFQTGGWMERSPTRSLSRVNYYADYGRDWECRAKPGVPGYGCHVPKKSWNEKHMWNIAGDSIIQLLIEQIEGYKMPTQGLKIHCETHARHIPP
ncbi:uncharacterized protein LOC131269577 [Anopheles coustani]|uniref:uncharacterized protein LOC131269577 n=1 Tax=Anopheles coustani TaxID=139045 RepID=UPI002658A872|nr:uncharacterized protein LOC131269577 [Anopheles coustani]